ncbi:hypothetical protein SISNIDRAFT_417287 [Sistotremastrum niveocremeum HHB9708]|uniref:Uncharacterized protein n=1 Tax=Sistotremastrum niveocremeum HHB9708 TaxID=1314777 RepID=A0A164PYX5_9AGAM|nr:hypothetical protein SISNIDRAFT_417287 [Sistotremastrum niveocremeum HHB9708]
MPPVLPVELIHEIVTLACVKTPNIFSSDQRFFFSQLTPCKPEWQTMDSLSRSCKCIRNIVMKTWFRHLCISCPDDLNMAVKHFPDIKTWADRLHFRGVAAEQLTLSLIQSFKRVRAIRVDLEFGRLYDLPELEAYFNQLPTYLVELEFRNITWPDYFAVKLISERFPLLRVLKLNQMNVWCGLCNTCSHVSLRDPFPEIISYDDGHGLPSSWSRLLSKLEKLEYVEISVPVSEGKIPYTVASKFQWSGECEWCMKLTEGDEDAQKRWVDKKNESPGPPSLRRVDWVMKHNELGFGIDSARSDAGQDTEDEEDEGTQDFIPDHDVVSSYLLKFFTL